MTRVPCPVCHPNFGGTATINSNYGNVVYYDCYVCGTYAVSHTFLKTHLEINSDRLTYRDRAILAHLIRTGNDRGGKPPAINSLTFKSAQENVVLPNPALQLTRLVRMIGNHVSEFGFSLDAEKKVAARLGCLDEKRFEILLKEGVSRKLLLELTKSSWPNPDGGIFSGSACDLSIDGWVLYQSESRGEISSTYGFLALKFNDEILDPMCANHLKPAIKEKLGYDLIDMRDVSQAGVIDNIMREQIRDCSFVLADLTHENPGAYWEAGYAEGLGKPVIYICEKAKFEKQKTHFDTNHCTTVLWAEGEEEYFVDSVIATIRRSLNPLVAALEPFQ